MVPEILSSDALWFRGCGRARLLFILRWSAVVHGVIGTELRLRGVRALLGDDMIALENLHQSLSARYIDTPTVRARLLQAGALIQARAFTLVFELITSSRKKDGSHHWALRPRDSCMELAYLLDASNAAVQTVGLPPGDGHTPHSTLAYDARNSLLKPMPIAPIEAKADAVELVVGGGDPYRYTTLGCWPLQPELPRPVQGTMF